MTQTRMFVSDGDPDTIVVPSDKAGNILKKGSTENSRYILIP